MAEMVSKAEQAIAEGDLRTGLDPMAVGELIIATLLGAEVISYAGDARSRPHAAPGAKLDVAIARPHLRGVAAILSRVSRARVVTALCDLVSCAGNALKI